jgi:hypothetical protein
MTSRIAWTFGLFAVTLIAVVIWTPFLARFVHLIQLASSDADQFKPIILDTSFTFSQDAVYSYEPQIRWPSRYEVGLKFDVSTEVPRARQQYFDGEILIRQIENNKILTEERIDSEKMTRLQGSSITEIVLYTLDIPHRGLGGSPRIEIVVVRPPTRLPPGRFVGLYLSVSAVL